MNLKERLKLNPAVAQVLVEYSEKYGNKKAWEMFNYLIRQIIGIFKSYIKNLVSQGHKDCFEKIKKELEKEEKWK